MRVGIGVIQPDDIHRGPGVFLTQVGLDASVSGDYVNIVKFMNSLQRSPNFYIVESLSLQAEGQADQTEGKAKQAGEHVKDAAGDVKDALGGH